MANPFLMEDPVDYADMSSAAPFNPFLCGSEEQFLGDPGTDNPFLSSAPQMPSMTAAVGTNPFADFSWEDTKGHDPGLLTPPAISNINDPENDFVVSSDDEAKPRKPPPHRPSMPKETQDLILSVTGALKATSDHLLDRLPPTRAPSPTAFHDLHSPSPTPDLFGGEDDLLSMTQQPARPAPPRPPSRPVPPQPPPPQPSQADMFDLFGTQAPPQPKTKDAILNLYSQPKSQPKDLLSEDIDLPLQPSLISDATIPTVVEHIVESEPLEEDDTTFETSQPSQEKVEGGSEEVPPALQSETSSEIRSEKDPGEMFAMDDEFSNSSVLPAESVAADPSTQEEAESDSSYAIFGTGPPPAVNNNNIFGSEAQSTEHEEERNSFGTAAPPPQLFGSGPPPKPEPPQLLPSRPPPPKPEPPSIFGSGPPPKPEPPSIFGSGPPPKPEPPSIFGSGPPPKPEPSAIFGSGPPPKPEPPSIFGSGPPPKPEPPSTTSSGPPPKPAPPSQIFGSGQVPYEPPQIFGAGPAPPSPDIFGTDSNSVADPYIFGTGPTTIDEAPRIFGVGPPIPEPAAQPAVDAFCQPTPPDAFSQQEPYPDAFGNHPAPPPDAFDAFTAKFEQADDHKVSGTGFDPFGSTGGTKTVNDAWGSGIGTGSNDPSGFDGDSFDTFLSMSQPPPPPTPNPMARADSAESEEGGFNVVIKPRDGFETFSHSGAEGVPALAPPPKSPAYTDTDPRFNPFDKNGQIPAFPLQEGFQLPPLTENEPFEGGFKRSDSQESPSTPLFDEDVSQPLEDFPRIKYSGEGWDMQLRQPNKKKITGQRFWKKMFVKLVYQGDNPVLQLFNLKEDKDPFQELPLQACYSVSDISAQQYDQFGKIFTVKLQYIFYKERPGVRPGQVTKAERITNKLSQFAAYAIQGDYQGVKEFGSDLKKLGLPVEHAPQISQLLKIGCMSFEDLKQFSVCVEECLFRMPVHRDRALNYKMEEVQITVVDELYVEQDAYGHVGKQIARVRLLFLAFLSGMPDVELGMNDLWRQGKEVVGRHDIIPVVTEEWIRLEAVEFHNCVQLDEYEQTRTIKFKPPDACYIELMRFRVRPPKNRELPLQLKAVMCVTGNKVELRADVLVPGVTSRKLGLIPCEDVMIRFPIPECWIYLFRVEKHFRYGSVKSAHRRQGKIKGIERFLGAVDNLEPSLMEVTSGQAKYEHPHRAIVWRMPRLPKDGQGAYTTHNLVCRMQLASYDQIPETLAEYAYVEFTMPATTASHTTVRSVSLVGSDSDAPPEKYVRQLARMEYRVGIEHTQGEEMASYAAATVTKPKTQEAAPAPAASPLPVDSDSDSSG